MMDTDHLFYPLGDCAIVIKLGQDIELRTHDRVIQITEALVRQPLYGMVEVVPAYTTVTVYYDPWIVSRGREKASPYDQVKEQLNQFVMSLEPSESTDKKTVDIPVCYGGEWGPDLDFVARHNGIKPEEVIRIHTSGEYPVYMIGFAPGFPYLGGMSKQIAAPRRQLPRPTVPSGSVGIAGSQTGVYSVETPGGWQLIGRTPMALFNILDSESEQFCLLTAGDKVRFYQITRNEYDSWEVNTS